MSSENQAASRASGIMLHCPRAFLRLSRSVLRVSDPGASFETGCAVCRAPSRFRRAPTCLRSMAVAPTKRTGTHLNLPGARKRVPVARNALTLFKVDTVWTLSDDSDASRSRRAQYVPRHSRSSPFSPRAALDGADTEEVESRLPNRRTHLVIHLSRSAGMIGGDRGGRSPRASRAQKTPGPSAK